MKNRRFSIFCACLVFGFFLAVPSSLYAEEGVSESTPVDVVSETPVTEENTAPVTETTEETAPQTEEQTATEPTEEIVEETVVPTVEEVTTEETTPAPEAANPPQSPSASESLPTFTLHIRLEGNILYEGETQIPQLNVDIKDNTGANHSVAGNSLLSALYTVDLAEDSFEITDLTYYESFGAFFMNCIKAAINPDPSCGNWIFFVNDAFPYDSIDQYTLQENDEVYVFFGSQYRALSDQESVELGQSVNGQAQTYNYKTNVWEGAGSVTLSVIQDNPDNPWSPIVVTSSPVSDTGSATFVLSATGSYKIGIDEDYYMHTAPFLVIDAVSAATSTPGSTPTSETNNSNTNNNNSCTDCNPPELVSQSTIDDTIEKILTYVKTQQKTTGAIQDGATTDWLIMSFGAKGIYADTVAATSTSLLDYAKNYSFSSGAELNFCAGYPRHVLALLAGGVDSSDTAVVELLQKIKSNECFDGTLYGEAGINDDIFALLSLLATGETVSGAQVSAIISSIISDQQTSGAFTWNGWEGSDVTGAAINALKYAVQKGATVDTAIFDKAKNYLKKEQLNDGGWGFGSSDVLTTSWAVMGINALGEGQSDWTQSSGKNPWNVLTGKLSPQGYYTSPFTGSKPDWFATKHAVPALKGSTWPIILTPVSTDNSSTCIGACNSRSEDISTKQTTSTEQIPTTTPHLLLDIPITVPIDLIGTDEETPDDSIDVTETTTSTENVAPVVLINEIGEETATAPSPIIRKPFSAPATRVLTNGNPKESETGIDVQNKIKDIPAIESPTSPPEAQTDGSSLGKKIAEKVFNSAAAGTATVGLFLAWRFMRALL